MGVRRDSDGVEDFLDAVKDLDGAMAPIALAARLGDEAAKVEKGKLFELLGKRVGCICAGADGGCSDCVLGGGVFALGRIDPPKGFSSWCEIGGDFTRAVKKMRVQAESNRRGAAFLTRKDEVEFAERQLDELRAKYERDREQVAKQDAEMEALKADVIEKARALGIEGVPACCACI